MSSKKLKTDRTQAEFTDDQIAQLVLIAVQRLAGNLGVPTHTYPRVLAYCPPELRYSQVNPYFPKDPTRSVDSV